MQKGVLFQAGSEAAAHSGCTGQHVCGPAIWLVGCVFSAQDPTLGCCLTACKVALALVFFSWNTSSSTVGLVRCQSSPFQQLRFHPSFFHPRESQNAKNVGPVEGSGNSTQWFACVFGWSLFSPPPTLLSLKPVTELAMTVPIFNS